MQRTEHKHFTDSLSYELELTAKYCRALGAKIASEICPELTFDEVIILDMLSCNKGICQRDLARLILKDRANTGRSLDSLEQRGYVKRYDDRKNNRLVRKAELSEKGSALIEKLSLEFTTAHNYFVSIIPDEESDALRKRLKKIRDNVKNVVDLQI